MKITIINRVCTSTLGFTDESIFKYMIKSIDRCLENESGHITYKCKNLDTKFSRDYLKNSLIEIEH